MDFPADDFDDSSSNDSNVELSHDSSSNEEPTSTFNNHNNPEQNSNQKMMFSLGAKTGGQKITIDFKNFETSKFGRMA